MDRVYYGGKTVVGQRVFDDNGIAVYQISLIRDKYLVINKRKPQLKEFIVSGLEVSVIIEYARRPLNEIESEIRSKISAIKRDVTHKKLRKPDPILLKKRLNQLFQKEKGLLVVAGLTKADIEKEAAFL